VAVAGVFEDQKSDPVIDAAIALRQQLDHWRRHHEWIASGISVGKSRAAIRLQKQIQLAGSVRSDLIIQTPPGCFAESIATAVHQRSAAGEPVATVEGPLMDPELLDASLGVVLNHLADSEKTRATAILKGIDETPPEAQQRLANILGQFGDRLRLIAIANRFVKTIRPDSDEPPPKSDGFLEDSLPIGIDHSLADRLCGLKIELRPLAERIEDVPVIVTWLLDRRKVAGDSVADRFARASLDALVIYPWPDNLRELDQAIRHASRVCRGQVIAPEHLPLAVRSYRPNESIPVDQQAIDLDEVVAEFESDLIRKTLAASGGNRAETARRLNISRARLLRKLESIDDGEEA
jgi:DNA-binding NtrC family response regulator